MSECDNCTNRSFREMIKKPYGYAGEIPCLQCSRFTFFEDKFQPIQEEESPLEKLKKQTHWYT